MDTDSDKKTMAFPMESHDKAERGMTLRDYFAAKALVGILASQHTPAGATYGALSKQAYKAADKMMEVRDV